MFQFVRGGFIPVLIAAMLAGCTVGDFKSAQGDDLRSVTVARPYQDVYRSVREYAKKCMEIGLVTAEMKVEAELYTDTNRAEVRVYLLGGLGKQNHFAVDIEGTAPNAANVVVRRGIRPLLNSSPRQL